MEGQGYTGNEGDRCEGLGTGRYVGSWTERFTMGGKRDTIYFPLSQRGRGVVEERGALYVGPTKVV